MQYKGDDLDLRVPQGRMPRESYPAPEADTVYGNGRWGRGSVAPMGPAGEPLWVDESILACCNTAYDMALAHGSDEVDLEHLVHAMTRIEAAARTLEARGVREGQLRRDSAAMIARDVPTNLAPERANPRRSADLEDVLRRAGEMAGRRGLAASLDDVLWVLLHYPRELPVIALLRRLTPDWQRLDWAGRGRETPEPRLPLVEARYMPAYGWEAPPRLSSVEDGLRVLHAEMSADRKLLADLVRDLQRDIVAQRSDAAALRSDIGQRLETLERSLVTRTETNRLPAQLAERLQQLEKAIHSGLGEGARNWAALGQRLTAFETALGTRDTGQSVQPIVERIAGLELALEARLKDTGTGLGHVAERLIALEAGRDVASPPHAEVLASVETRLAGLETMLALQAEGAAPGGAFEARVAGLETAVRSGFGDTTRMQTLTLDRIADLERRQLEAPAADDEALLIVEERLAAIDAHLAEQGRGGDRGILPAAGLDEPGRQQFAELTQSMAGLNERIERIDEAVRAGTAAWTDSTHGRDRDIADLHDGLVRLSENQSTLASAIADWRSESHDRFALVAARLERITADELEPAAALPQTPANRPMATPPVEPPPAHHGDDLPKVARPAATHPATIPEPPSMTGVEIPERRGHGFWWWLFGTDHVRTANRDAQLRVERMRQGMKDARERRRTEA